MIYLYYEKLYSTKIPVIGGGGPKCIDELQKKVIQ